jgi:hypothetical protein
MNNKTKADLLAAKIKAETPFSITSTDNAIFKAKIDLKCLISAGAQGGDEFEIIPAGTHVRICDCDLDESGQTMIRYNPRDGYEYDFKIDNRYLEYVSGNLGARIEEEE